MPEEILEQKSAEESFAADLGLDGDFEDLGKKPEVKKEKEGKEEEVKEKIIEENVEEQTEENTLDQIEKDLTPEEVDKLPKDAKGMYHALKKTRDRMKAAEAKLNYIEIQNRYGNKDVKVETDNVVEDEKFETVDDILEGKDENDLLTVGEQRRIRIAEGNEKRVKDKKNQDNHNKLSKEHKTAIERVDSLEKVFRTEHPDYDEMLEVFKLVVKDMPSVHHEIMAEMKQENGNPAKKVYDIGKKFKTVYGQKKPENGNPKKDDVKKILKNAEKNINSASMPGSSVTNEALEEMDLDDLGKTLANMSMSQYMKVPRKIRNKLTK